MATNPYLALKDAFLKQLEATRNKEAEQLKSNLNQKISSINSMYDKAANSAYVNYRQGQKYIPERLSSQGLTGGASETANINLQTAYSKNLAQNEDGRAQAISSANTDYGNRLSQVNLNYNKQKNDGINKYDAEIAQWEEAERKRKEEEERRKKEEAERAAAASRSYSRGGGGGRSYYRRGGGGGGTTYDYSAYADNSGSGSETYNGSGYSYGGKNSKPGAAGLLAAVGTEKFQKPKKKKKEGFFTRVKNAIKKWF